MQLDEGALHRPTRPAATKQQKIAQWLVCIVLLACTAGACANLATAPTATVWMSVLIGGGLTIVHSPPVFFRLPRAGRWGGYLAIIIFLTVWSDASRQAKAAYERTPQGAKEAADRRVRDKIASEAAALTAASERGRESREKAQACLEAGDHIPRVEEALKDSLDNPASYQFLGATVGMVRDDQATVFIGLRFENRFGAIRKGLVRVTMNTNDCSAVDIGEPYDE